MNKVLVTGLGIAREFGICDSCNLDVSWLANNPSIHLPFCGQTNYIFHIRLLKHKLNKWNEKMKKLLVCF